MKKTLVFLLPLVLLAALAAGQRRESAAAAAPPRLLIWVDLDAKTLTLYENGEAVKRYPIASGARDTPSPIGVFRVSSRFLPSMSGFGTRFLGLSVPWGSYGIHGTNKPESIGQNASHGCIRMRVGDMESLFPLIPNGTQVAITGGPYGPLNWGGRTLQEGDRGADVRQLQLRLIQRGLLRGGADGVFGPATKSAVAAARKELNLSPGVQADPLLQEKLGMILFE
ncbi:MAG: L,D-transpeptidase family protein [Clostridia bacterium]|nr:L,D-transpeptidase family protein [Clostridia bacterium]